MRSLTGVLAVLSLAATAVAQPQRPPARDSGPKVGDVAPLFDLPRIEKDENVKLKTLQGKPVVLIFGSCT